MINLKMDSAALDFLEKIRKSQPKHHRQIIAKIEILRHFRNPPRTAKVFGKGEEARRIPAGEYRIIYQDGSDGLRRIKEIGKRNDGAAYRDFGRVRKN